ncbi:MAG: Tad domain-containing protein [Acidobacteria bacterium]|nr:Tad domain-containing protein [Acidobacteriota bacterium]
MQTAIAFIGLTAFSAFVVDYGVLWSARRQAQNSADAAAMAAAVSLGFVDPDDQQRARNAALDAAAQNRIWGAPPDITGADITFPACPVGSPGVGTNSCVRVDVFRNQRGGGNPLPTIFGNLVGVTNQGVRATATAQVIFGNSTNCVKPWGIPDKWTELRNNQGPPGWDDLDSFERYVQNGRNRGQVLNPADVYTPPTNNNNGTGFDVQLDYGLQIEIKSGNPNQALQPGWFSPVVINPSCVGGNCYRDAIAQCAPNVIRAGDVLTVEPGNMIGPTNQGVTDLINLDPTATWSPSANGGRGGISGGCMSSQANPCALSPRVVAVPVFDPDVWDRDPARGRNTTVTVTRIVGMFIERMRGNDVIGRLMPYPSSPYSGTGGVPGSAFVISIILVR